QTAGMSFHLAAHLLPVWRPESPKRPGTAARILRARGGPRHGAQRSFYMYARDAAFADGIGLHPIHHQRAGLMSTILRVVRSVDTGLHRNTRFPNTPQRGLARTAAIRVPARISVP